MKEQKYFKEEFHRGEWIPLMITTKDGEKKQGIAMITDLQAEHNNRRSQDTKIRYVLKAEKVEVEKEEKREVFLIEEVDTLEVAREKWKKTFGTKPMMGWKDVDFMIQKQQEKLNK